MASQQPGDQHPQSQYVPVPTDPMHQQQQQQQVQNTLSSVPSAPTASTGNYPAFDLGKFWTEQMQLADMFESDFKNHPLPLARIKKVMKTDQEVKMISAEAPVLFAKGCEIFITELTKRAWVHAEENKRRTLQRSDIATAISKTDMCDFLIDIVPREEAIKTQSAPFEQAQQQTQQPEYGSYYPAQGGVPQYAPQQSMEAAAYASYSQLTAEQMQQYQLQLQQYAAQQQQQQQQLAYPHGAESSTAAQQPSANSNPTTKAE
ncbi:Mitochondrial tRNAs modification protein [Mucor velutinosus]|uniref:Mitochondrial tRNAs modification protein n=1 Tax=Mucor velutinosus TaxID=708070 RepID=A0AAN7HQ17_9FUNG|nr:Mitochondrial tRNAs modification protein [Mucor velutinosus]